MARVDIAVPGIRSRWQAYTPATRAGDLVFAAGHLASDFKHGVAPEARLDPAFPCYGSSIKKQTRYVLENLARTFEAAGTSLESRREGAGISDRPRALQRIRRGVARILPDAAAADDDRHQRPAGSRLPGRGRPDRHDAEDRGSRGAVQGPRPLANYSRRSSWAISFLPPASWPAISRPASRAKHASIRRFRSMGRTSSARRATSSRTWRGRSWRPAPRWIRVVKAQVFTRT